MLSSNSYGNLPYIIVTLGVNTVFNSAHFFNIVVSNVFFFNVYP
jgi:hypothetical protein